MTAPAGSPDLQTALHLHKAGQFDRARNIYREILARNPGHYNALHYLGLLEAQLGNFEPAISLIGRSLKLQPGNKQIRQNYASILVKAGRHDSAIQACNEGLRSDPTNVYLLYLSAVALFQLRRLPESLRQYDKVLKVKPDHAIAINERGAVLAEMKEYDQAIAAFQKAVALDPKFADAYLNIGNLFGELKRYEQAKASFDKALQLNPRLARAWSGLGDVLCKRNLFDEAFSAFEKALNLEADLAAAWLGRGNVYTALKQFDSALAAYDRALSAEPDLAEAWLGRGNVLSGLRQYDSAFTAYDRALSLKPNLAEAWLGRGKIYSELKQYDNALAAYDRALDLKSDLGEAWLGRGNVHTELKQYDNAFAAYDRALSLDSDLAETWLGRGNVYAELKQYDNAFAAYDRALSLEPNLAQAWLGRGNVYAELKQYDDAFAAYDRALNLEPDLAQAWLGRGNVCAGLKQYDDAFAAYERALSLKSDLAEAWLGRGKVCTDLRQYDKAFAAYERALSLEPDSKYVEGLRLISKMHLCDWTNLGVEISDLLSRPRERKPATPFVLLLISSSSEDQLRCAKAFVEDQGSFPALWKNEIYSHDRIRIAYLSSDFHEHATAYLMAGLFEQHDEARFEVTAVSFGPAQNSHMRQRIESGVEHFVDVRNESDQEIAEFIRQREIDIVIDLKGFTTEARYDVLARRAAPLQVNYLGYPGTMGADYIDYIIADPTIIPKENFSSYTECVVWLPDSYQVNDSQRRISEVGQSRRECGLPENAFVYCCFNNPYKILPDIFDVWMRLLRANENSVLWLFEKHPAASANLCREAEKRGVSAERLIFASQMALPDHLARHRHADLFLDTLPYNAHTTASDALWSGVPVLTCLGTTFAGRVAGSLLTAVGLDELITSSVEEYEAMALQLAREPSHLAALKDRLLRNRSTYPLFNTERFARNIETAFLTMWERYQRGLSPEAFAVAPPD